jgi:hypothetical protein
VRNVTLHPEKAADSPLFLFRTRRKVLGKIVDDAIRFYFAFARWMPKPLWLVPFCQSRIMLSLSAKIGLSERGPDEARDALFHAIACPPVPIDWIA